MSERVKTDLNGFRFQEFKIQRSRHNERNLENITSKFLTNYLLPLAAAVTFAILVLIARKAIDSGALHWLRVNTSRVLIRYAVWRASRALREWFSDKNITHFPIQDLEAQPSIPNSVARGVQRFAFMQLGQPALCPKLNDYIIASGIRNLIHKGNLVRLPEARIGGSYTNIGYQPNDAQSYTIAINKDPIQAKACEEAAELERKCKECHAWPITPACSRQRYSFESSEVIEGNRTTYTTQSVLNEGADECGRCWEQNIEKQVGVEG